MRAIPDSRQMTGHPKNGHPKGTVLIFTLAILALMSIMGMAIIMNTKTELSISRNSYMGREAFTRADTAVRVSIFVARLYMHPELGDPASVFSGNSDDPLEVTITDDGFNLADELFNIAETWDFRKRYIAAASRTDTGGDNKPHLIFRQHTSDGPSIVGTAALSIDHGETIRTGGSLGMSDRYDTSGGSSMEVILAATVNGRPPSDENAAYEQESGQAPSDSAHSVITTLFRDIF